LLYNVICNVINYIYFSVSLFYVCVMEREKTLSRSIFVSSESFGLFDYGLHKGVDKLKNTGV